MATMLMVSCRRDFWSATDFSNANAGRRIDLESSTGQAVPHDEFLREVRSKRITVLVHGYNNEERDVTSAAPGGAGSTGKADSSASCSCSNHSSRQSPAE
jgi:hypothetical protein